MTNTPNRQQKCDKGNPRQLFQLPSGIPTPSSAAVHWVESRDESDVTTARERVTYPYLATGIW